MLSIPPRATLRAVGTGLRLTLLQFKKLYTQRVSQPVWEKLVKASKTFEHFKTVVEQLETTVEHPKTVVQHFKTNTSRLSSILRSLRKSRPSGTPKPPSTLALKIMLPLPNTLRPTSMLGPPFTLSPPIPSKLLGRRANNAHVSALLLPSRWMSFPL